MSSTKWICRENTRSPVSWINRKKLDHDQHPGDGAINEYGALKVEQDRKEVEKVEIELEEKIEEMHLEKEDLSCDFSPIGNCLETIT